MLPKKLLILPVRENLLNCEKEPSHAIAPLKEPEASYSVPYDVGMMGLKRGWCSPDCTVGLKRPEKGSMTRKNIVGPAWYSSVHYSTS
jgi:hypothetical protein